MNSIRQDNTPPSPPRRWRKLPLALLGLGLAALVLFHSLAAYLANTAPGTALWLRPHLAQALIQKSDETLAPIRTLVRSRRAAVAEKAAEAAAKGTAPPDDESDPKSLILIEEEEALSQTQAWIKSAIAIDPMSATAFRLMGELADMKGERDLANKWMTLSARRWFHETSAQYHVMITNILAGRFEPAVETADYLLRTRPELWQSINPLLMYVVEAGKRPDLVVSRLELSPPWRGNFMSEMVTIAQDVRSPWEIIKGLQKTRSPATMEQVTAYLNHLLRRRQYGVAQYVWLQQLPPEQLARVRNLYNGDFQEPVGSLALDWVLQQGIGARVEIAEHTEKDRGLKIELGPERVTYGRTAQWLFLPAGSYNFSGKFRGSITGRRGMVWRIFCQGERETEVAQSQQFIGPQRNWREFTIAFEIPSEGCEAQQLRLNFDGRHSAEQFASGVMWFDDLDISRRLPLADRSQ